MAFTVSEFDAQWFRQMFHSECLFSLSRFGTSAEFSAGYVMTSGFVVYEHFPIISLRSLRITPNVLFFS